MDGAHASGSKPSRIGRRERSKRRRKWRGVATAQGGNARECGPGKNPREFHEIRYFDWRPHQAENCWSHRSRVERHPRQGKLDRGPGCEQRRWHDRHKSHSKICAGTCTPHRRRTKACDCGEQCSKVGTHTAYRGCSDVRREEPNREPGWRLRYATHRRRRPYRVRRT